MVKRITNLLYKEFSGLHEAAFLLGGFAILSQILALLRDRLFAHSFGAGSTLDMYYAAFRIPDFLYVSLASFVSVTVLIPFLVKKLESGDEAANKFLNNVFTVFFISIIAASAVLFIFIPQLSQFIFPGFPGDMQETLVTITRILLLSPILLGLSNLAGSITQSFRKFFVYALSPVLYNLGIIAGVIFLYPIFGIPGLVYGVVLGALLHLAIQLPVLAKYGFIPRPTFKINWSEIRKVVALSLPRTLGLSIHQISLIVLASLASVMAVGSIAIFNLSFNLQSVPLAIIGVSYSVAAFPTLAKLFSENNTVRFISYVSIAARHIIFWSFPIMALFIVLRAQIVRTILGSGAFDWSDTRLTAATLAFFAISLVAQGLILLFVRAFYAAGDTKTPVFVNVGSAIFIIMSAYFFVFVFEHYDSFRYFMEALLRITDIEGTVVTMLALAYSLGMVVNAVLLGILFRRHFGKTSLSIYKTFVHSFSAAVFMGFVAYQSLYVFGLVLDTDTFLGIFLQGLFSGILGIVAGVFLLRFMGNTEIVEIWKSLHSKFWKTKSVIAPEKEEL